MCPQVGAAGGVGRVRLQPMTSARALPAFGAGLRRASVSGRAASDYAPTYFLSSLRRTWLLLVSAVSAFDTDISPDLLPFRPIFSRISPRVRPWPWRITFISSSRLEPRRACRTPDDLRAPVCRVGPLPLFAASYASTAWNSRLIST